MQTPEHLIQQNNNAQKQIDNLDASQHDIIIQHELNIVLLIIIHIITIKMQMNRKNMKIIILSLFFLLSVSDSCFVLMFIHLIYVRTIVVGTISVFPCTNYKETYNFWVFHGS